MAAQGKAQQGYQSGNGKQHTDTINVISHQNGERSDKLLRQGWTKGTSPLYPCPDRILQNRHFVYVNLDNATSSFLLNSTKIIPQLHRQRQPQKG